MFTLAAFLLSVTLILNAPLLILVFLGRRRLDQVCVLRWSRQASARRPRT
jgi:hypothetical protein